MVTPSLGLHRHRVIEKAIFNTNASNAQKKCFKNFHAPIDLSCIFARLPEPQRLLQLSKSLQQVVLREESVIKTTETQKSEIKLHGR